ncbi:MAG: AAA family ATPase [Eubacteriales bacterium]|nr:AAA family ATPase [Eubacteriales bacterium]
MAESTLSYSMQFVALRARAEADHMHREPGGIEFWFLGILKLSELKARDAFRLPDEKLKSIDEDIAYIRESFRQKEVDTGILRLLLRHKIKHGADLQPEMESEYMKRALGYAQGRGKDQIWARDLLVAILCSPTPLLQSVLFDQEENSPGDSGEKPGQDGKKPGADSEAPGSEQASGKDGKMPPEGASGKKNSQDADGGSGGKRGRTAGRGGSPDGSRTVDSREPAGEAESGGGKPEKEPDEMSPDYLPFLTGRVRRLREKLLGTVQGQDHVVHAFCEGYFASEVLAASDAGRKRPRAIFAFVGPPGVGKTFLAETAAEELGLPYMRFNMSTYSDHQSYTGLVGFEKSYQAAREGLLTGFVKKNPRSILLFDEIEKAHLNTINLFLQILDAGVLADRFHQEDVVFKDTVIIFTSNAGTSLYEEGAKTNGAGVSRKVLLKALETEKDSRTGAPFFPAAITSRLATGWPILFNHLMPRDLAKISERELARVSRLFEDQYGLGCGFDPTVATALLFREGGAADARTVRAQTELFFKNEIFKVCRLWGEESFADALKRLKKLYFTIETEGMDPEVSPLFESEEKPEILLYGNTGAAQALIRELPEFVFHCAHSMEEAMEIAGAKEIRLALVEIAGRDAEVSTGGTWDSPGPADGQAAGEDLQATVFEESVRERIAEDAAGQAADREDLLATVFEESVRELKVPGGGPGREREQETGTAGGKGPENSPGVDSAGGKGPENGPGADSAGRTDPEDHRKMEPSGELLLSVGAFDFLPMAAGVFRDGARVFAALRERMPEIPVYLMETTALPLDEELVMNYVRLGARGKIAVPDESGEERSGSTGTAGQGGISGAGSELERICADLWMQKASDRLAAEHRILSFETVPHLSEDRSEVNVRLRSFGLRRAPDAEDAGSLLDEAEKPDVRFADVIGCADAKDELQFFVEFLKNPRKFSARGLKPPKGVLLYGPPGTGKTMLARAMAGESDVSFLPAAASTFVTKWAGSGPQAVRDLFRKARRYAPAIVFIDEIDAIGRRRGDSGGGHGEEMALNALLTEMDGFEVDPKRPVFVLAATNFDVEEGRGGMGVLDPAMVRRFDRQVLVDLPGTDDREKLLHLLIGKISGAAVTDAMIRRTAERSVGMSPANLTGIVDQANRMAVKAGRPLDDSILDEAFELTKHGAKKDWGYEYLERVARHECGHAFLCTLGGNTPAYLTIEARGSHGGYMEHSEKDMAPLSTRKQLIDRIRTSLGGRAAELVYYGEEEGLSTGVSGDLQQATRTAAAMLCAYGMDPEYGLVAMDPGEAMKDPAFRTRVRDLLDREMRACEDLIRENRTRIDRLVTALLSRNKLTAQEIEEILQE